MTTIAQKYDNALLDAALAPMMLEKFADQTIMKATWKELISDILHFRWPSRTKVVFNHPVPDNKSETYKWRRYDHPDHNQKTA